MGRHIPALKPLTTSKSSRRGCCSRSGSAHTQAGCRSSRSLGAFLGLSRCDFGALWPCGGILACSTSTCISSAGLLATACAELAHRLIGGCAACAEGRGDRRASPLESPEGFRAGGSARALPLSALTPAVLVAILAGSLPCTLSSEAESAEAGGPDLSNFSARTNIRGSPFFTC